MLGPAGGKGFPNQGGVMAKRQPPPPGYKLVFCRSFVHPKTKRRVYPKRGKSFAFLVKV